jgi:hypothetical protein
MEELATYRNHYRHCGHEWVDDWSCMCNDRCPKCNKEIEPWISEALPTAERTPMVRVTYPLRVR